MSSWTPGRPTIGANRPDVAALEKRLAALEKAISVDPAGNVTIKGINVTIEANATVKIKGAATVSIDASGMVEVKGAQVKLNQGGKPLARVGDPVTVTGPVGTIIAGNPTILA